MTAIRRYILWNIVKVLPQILVIPAQNHDLSIIFRELTGSCHERTRMEDASDWLHRWAELDSPASFRVEFTSL